MGMAASQARLLTITARIHDVEYQAQSIQNAKLQLATQEDRVYAEYNEALNATTLTLTMMDDSGEKSTIPATFNNLFSRKKVRIANGTDYALFNDKGQLVVDDDIYEAYSDMKSKGVNDPYQFAMYMSCSNRNQWLGGAGLQSGDVGSLGGELQKAEEKVFQAKKDAGESKDEDLIKMHDKLLEYVEGNDIYDETKLKNPEDKSEYKALLDKYRAALYKNYAKEIGDATSLEDEDSKGEDFINNYDYDSEDFSYYLDMFRQIESNPNGCVPISEYSGSFGDASNNNEWLQGMVESGRFTIEKIERKDGQVKFDSVSVSSESCLGYTETSTIDKTALAKAEAKYEYDMRQIDKKDKQYDLTLSKLETERQALTTEYDSVKKVIEDNVDRTFGIFS